MKRAERKGDAPKVVAFIIADGLWQDPNTGKKTLHGMFTEIHAFRFPLIQELLIHVAMTHHEGSIPISIRLMHAQYPSIPLLKATTILESQVRDSLTELNIEGRVRFPRAGTYDVCLYVDESLVSRRNIQVKQAGESS